MNNYDRLYGAPKKRFDRNSLPSPLKYLTEHGLLLRKPRSEWASIICPAHKGGDILALHRLITGQGFMDAVRDLGGSNE